MTHDVLGRAVLTTAPDGRQTVTFAYHPQMALKSVSASTGYDYVASLSYDAAGRVDVRKLGALPTLQVDYDYFDWGVGNGQGRLKQIKAGPPGDPAGLFDLRYFSGVNTPAYDAEGNILNMYDYKSGNPQAQSFQYDALDRLTSAAADGTPGAYTEGYTYDPTTGNLSSKAGVSYGYATQSSVCPDGALSKAHAVTSVGSNAYCYDPNGNMVRRTIGGSVYNLAYDAEHRLTDVSGAATAAFVYDGDGRRVKGTVGGITTSYIGDYFEWSGSSSTMKHYYYAGGTRIAVREGSGSGTTGLSWLVGDHLGSTSVVATSSGGLQSRVLCKAWGEPRYASASLPTQYTFTGQYSYMDDISTSGVIEGFGLMYYNARWYNPTLGRWNQPDTIVPDQNNSLDWDRYSYVRNNPLNFTDPDGHRPCNEERGCGDTPVDEFQLKLGRSFEGEWDTEAQKEATKKVERAFQTGEILITILLEPADWTSTAYYCLNGECSPHMLLGLLPIIPSSVGHHKIPRQILKILPPDVAKAVRGAPGSPNIWKIPQSLHKAIHSGPGGGGYYNAVWREAIKPLLARGNITPQEIFSIRDQLVAAFSIWKWKP